MSLLNHVVDHYQGPASGSQRFVPAHVLDNSHTTVWSTARQVKSTTADLVKLGFQILRPPPTANDGLYANEAALPSDAVQTRSLFREVAASLVDVHTPANMLTIAQLMRTLAGKVAGKSLDDRELLLEYIVQWLSSLAPNSPIAAAASGAFISVFWKDMDHPPQMSLGDQYRFRTWDGSHNNLQVPLLGAAGQPYARSVSAKHPVPAHTLPDPADVFDRVMKRPAGKFEAHPSGLSALFTAFATTVIHTVFRTNREKPEINDTSSYVDLSILYGHTEKLSRNVRTFEYGLIHPDVVAEDRLFNFPPAILALVVVFSRNHNFLAERLLKLNEKGTFKTFTQDQLDKADPETRAKMDAQLKSQDEEIFQTARLINCGHYAQVVLHDYLRSILGLVSTDSTWVLDPRTSASKAEVGGGNVCAVEFNMLYRWHATMSQGDADYTEEWLRYYLPDDKKTVPLDKLGRADFGAVLKAAEAAIGIPPNKEDYGDNVENYQHHSMKRDPVTKRFRDEDLAGALLDAHSKPAHAYGARSTPAIMRFTEIAGMIYARNVWKCCTLNEFRKSLGLKPLTTFHEFNNNPSVARAFEQLYGHPDNIELYAGLICEQTKPTMVGAGICPGYTMSRAILSDAVALVRGDRFFTTCFDAGSLTSFGFLDCVTDGNNGAYGGVLPKLFSRALPNSFRFNSLAMMFPFQTPESMQVHLARLGTIDKYSLDPRPKQLAEWQYVSDPTVIDAILNDSATFNVPYAASISTFSARPDVIPFMMGTDNVVKHDISRKLVTSVLFTPTWDADVETYCAQKTRELLKAHSYQVDDQTSQVNIVRDVCNLVPIYFWADQFGIPLKTEATPLGLFTPAELQLMLSGLFAYTALNYDSANGWALRESSLKSAKILRGIIDSRLSEVAALGLVHSVVDGFRKRIGLNAHDHLGTLSHRGYTYYGAMLKQMGKHSRDEITNSTLGVLVASCAQPSDMLSQMCDLYLSTEQSRVLNRLRRLATQPMSPSVRGELVGYFYESMRLSSSTAVAPRYVAKDKVIVGKEGPIKFSGGDRIIVDLHALRGVDDPNPKEVVPTRPHSQYRVLGYGMRECVAKSFVLTLAPVMMREIFSLAGLARAPGPAGQIHSFKQEFGKSGFRSTVFIDRKGMPFPSPVSMSVRYRPSAF